jgi:GTPase SAR1 family protein
MISVHEHGHPVDRVVTFEELKRLDMHDAVGGISYLVSLDEGLPALASIDGYISALRRTATLRKLAGFGNAFRDRCLLQTETPEELLASGAEFLSDLAESTQSTGIDNLPAVADTQDEVPYLIKPELPAGCVIGVTGDSGSGKSTLATAWARDIIATGRPCLLLDRESPRAVARDRMARLNLLDNALLRWAGGWIGDVPDPGSPKVIGWVRQTNPKPLVLIDSLAAFLGGDENSASDMRDFMHKARRLADMGATVVVIHHDGKAESAKDFRGSSDFKASLDQGFHTTNISSDGKLDRIRLRCFKSRFGLNGEIVYHYAGGRFVRDERPDAPIKTVTAQLTALLRQFPGLNASQFEDKAAAEGIGRNRARDFLGDGVLSGFIDLRTGSRNAKKYWLKEAE